MASPELVPTPPFPPAPRRPGDPEPDLSGFAIVHRALRSGSRDVADACAALASGAPGPQRPPADVAWFAGHVLYEIRAHHRKEDDVLWPVIALSAGEHVDLGPLSDDHRALEGLLERVDGLLAAFRRDPAAAGELAVAMGEIADELDEHIADEEETVFPVMRAYVSAGDFARCEKLFQRGVPFSHLRFLLPWVVGECTPDERAQRLPSAPLPVRVILRSSEPGWRRRAAAVRGRTAR